VRVNNPAADDFNSAWMFCQTPVAAGILPAVEPGLGGRTQVPRRKNRPPTHDKYFQRRCERSPSPGGEGRGEDGRFTNFTFVLLNDSIQSRSPELKNLW